MVIYAGGPSAYQLSEFSGQVDFFVWFLLFVIWAVATTRPKSTRAATPEEQQRVRQLARRRYWRITAACAAVAILWPALAFCIVYHACSAGACS
ncbi:hypothetical protein [Streptacidiphilus melanogenes]|uniref:hypothetical protein n=1 Tax=Streptacidiphilus melanogenes TaxID=411235 RepID=UPI0005AB27CF|nr:hypothetical protein [Streptacidiphilus melanogenes]